MIDKSEIISAYKKKIDVIKKHNKFYFSKDDPKILDAEYDLLKKEVLDLEKKYLYLKKIKNKNTMIGAPPSNKFKKIKHLHPMLSLSTSFNKNDIIDFLIKIKNFLNLESSHIELFSEPKIDGISATLIYENGLLTKGLSRGDGTIGEDILENLKTISKIPKKIKAKNFPRLMEIRCEIYISKRDFIDINKKFANPRNAAGGSLRQKDPKETSKPLPRVF